MTINPAHILQRIQDCIKQAYNTVLSSCLCIAALTTGPKCPYDSSVQSSAVSACSTARSGSPTRAYRSDLRTKWHGTAAT